MDIDALLARLPFERLRHPPPLVTVLRLSGVIGRVGPTRPGMTLAATAGLIERAFAPSFLSAVALVVNSPGGSPVQSSLIHRRVRQKAKEKGVPVFAFVEDVAASGGYWLALAGDEIFADESSIVGSIGVVTAGFGFQDLLARAGVERRVHAHGERKGMLDPFRPERPEDIERLMALQADIHDSFKALVRERRGARLKAGDDGLFEGDIWTGRQAVALGLVDGLGELRQVMRERFGEEVRLRLVGARRPWIRGRRFGFLGGADPGTWAESLLAAVEERALWGRYGL